MSKDKVLKTKCPKKYRYTAQEVANLTKSSVSYVEQIRELKCAIDSPKAKQIQEVDQILYDGSTALLREVERILK